MIDLEGTRYNQLKAVDGIRTAEERVDWLMSQSGVSPGSFDWLASVFIRRGDEIGARVVRVNKEHHRYTTGSASIWSAIIWYNCLGPMIGHGQYPWNLLAWVLGIYLFSILILHVRRDRWEFQLDGEVGVWLYVLDCISPINLHIVNGKFPPLHADIWSAVQSLWPRFLMIFGWISVILIGASLANLVN